MSAKADDVMAPSGDADLPMKLHRSNSWIAILLSWNVLVPLCVLSVAAIALAVGSRAYRRWEALTYLAEHDVDYVLAADGEWITAWFGDRAIGLRTVEMIDLSNIPEDGWDKITELNETTYIKCDRRRQFPEGAIATLKHLTHLETVKFSGWAFAGDTLVEFFAARPPLENVAIGIGGGSNQVLRELSQIRTIAELDLWPYFTDPDAYSGLSTLPNLRHASFHECIDGHGLEWVSRSPLLETLAVYSSSVTDEEIAVLAAATNLREVEFVYCPQIDHAGWEHLASLPHLESITLTPAKLTPETMAVFQRMPSLTEVNVRGPLPEHVRSELEGQALPFAVNELPAQPERAVW